MHLLASSIQREGNCHGGLLLLNLKLDLSYFLYNRYFSIQSNHMRKVYIIIPESL